MKKAYERIKNSSKESFNQFHKARNFSLKYFD